MTIAEILDSNYYGSGNSNKKKNLEAQATIYKYTELICNYITTCNAIKSFTKGINIILVNNNNKQKVDFKSYLLLDVLY